MISQKIPILLNCLAALFGAFGQYYYKKGSALLHERVFNLPIVIGIILFCVVMGLFVAAYKLGGRISIVYPFYATTFVWGALIGLFIENEPMNIYHWIGLGFLMMGLTILASQTGVKIP